MRNVKIGMIGLDTSHATAFTKMLNDPSHPYHVKGGKVVMAFPVGSDDFELSYSRIKGITKEVEQCGVQVVDTIEEVADQCDAILVESVDGRVHLEQVSILAPFKKPIFIDKPLCLRSSDALEIVKLSEKYGTPIMSSSALRFAQDLRRALATRDQGNIIGADCFGPMEMVETQPGYFWYGIHTIEMLYTILGCGSQYVTAFSNQDTDLVISKWKDGRIGTVRGNRAGNYHFGAVIHFEKGNEYVQIDSSHKPFYASLLEQILMFFDSGESIIPLNETIEIIRFIEAANESRETGKSVSIGG
ncbi:Gfo/Idh/MocA family oxidoreductase [Bacillus tianshenii]|uniref:Gfo/Idh/MocA family protein n=1 Tax=Sutcliffiella tianshenii TaxID=1463404 RepID=UPI001CD486EB|nr:Gfo/Idh/MocA family oxidoreductase [Bacillus tianshenii]MCA1318456.1 Gfo/Idh/MocA family oxidoreductase [Bacillus tianshenii]